MERGRGFVGDSHQVAKFFEHLRHGGAFDEPGSMGLGDLCFEGRHLMFDRNEFLEHRFESIGSEVHFLDQSYGFVASDDQATPGGSSFGDCRTAADGGMEVGVVAFEQVSEGFDIRTDPAHDRNFFRGVCHAHFDGSVKPQASIADLFEKFCRSLEHEVGSEHPVAVMESGLFDMSSGEDFFLAGEQGDLSHLHQVHTDRVLGRIDEAIVFGEEALGFFVRQVIVARTAWGAQRLGFIDIEFDSPGDHAAWENPVGDRIDQIAIFLEVGFLGGVGSVVGISAASSFWHKKDY